MISQCTVVLIVSFYAVSEMTRKEGSISCYADHKKTFRHSISHDHYLIVMDDGRMIMIS